MEIELSRLVDMLPGLVWTTGPDGVPDFVNKAWRDYTGLSLDAVRASEWTLSIHPEDLSAAVAAWNDAIVRGETSELTVRLRRFDGAYRRFNVQARPMRDAAGVITGWCGINTDVEDQTRAEALLAAERRLLELVARGMPQQAVLDELCFHVEALSPGCICSILFVDPGGQHFRVGAGPNLPDAYNAVLEGKEIDPRYGPCSLAVETRSTIITDNPLTDARWASSPWPELVTGFGLTSCWSAPILGSREQVLGIFATYRREPVGPTSDEQELIDRFAKLAGIAIERAESDALLAANAAELLRTNHFLAGAQRLSKTGSFYLDPLTDEQVWSQENFEIWEFDPAVQPTMEMVLNTIHPEDRHSAFKSLTDAVEAREGCEVVYRIVTPGSGVKHLHTTMEIIPEFTDRIVYLGTSQDITASKLAEEALRASEDEVRRANRYLRSAQRLSKTASYTWDVAADNLDWSEEMYRIWEIPLPEERAVMPTLNLVMHPDDIEPAEAIMASALKTWSDYEVSYRIIAPSGAIKYLHTVSERIKEIPDRLVYVGATQDLTESRLAEDALRASEAELRRANRYLKGAQTLSRIGSFTWDVESDEQDWSDENYRIWEVDPADRPTMSIVMDAIHPDDVEMVTATLTEAARTSADLDLVYRIVTRSGVVKHLHTVSTLIPEITGRRVYIGSTQDVTESKVAEAALRASEADLARANAYLIAAQRLSQTGSFTWDVAADEHNWSEVIYRVFGWEPGTKVTMEMMMGAIHPEDLPQVEALIGGAQIGENFELVFRVITRSGEVRHAHVMGQRIDQIPDRPVFMGALQDITARKQAEDDLSRARDDLAHVSRVTALSALTASIAHEVNQPLAGIITNASTCLRMLAADPPDIVGAQATAQRTIRDGNRASEVIKRLRALFSRTPLSLEPIDLHEAAREVLTLVAGELQRRRVTVRTEFADDPPSVAADRIQLQQVILNLILNAADAMAEVAGRPRELRVATRFDHEDIVTLDVRDTGPGVDPQRIDELFQPFHTTKAGGMGIGLAVSRSIIEAHGGRLSAARNPTGPGATFSFSIPRDGAAIPGSVSRQA
jgi:PAS domain S-box-containing protein